MILLYFDLSYFGRISLLQFFILNLTLRINVDMFFRLCDHDIV